MFAPKIISKYIQSCLVSLICYDVASGPPQKACWYIVTDNSTLERFIYIQSQTGNVSEEVPTIFLSHMYCELLS